MRLIKECRSSCERHKLLIADKVEYFFLTVANDIYILVTDLNTMHLETRCPECFELTTIVCEDSTYPVST